jgi:hypothetical protein
MIDSKRLAGTSFVLNDFRSVIDFIGVTPASLIPKNFLPCPHEFTAKRRNAMSGHRNQILYF